MPVRADALDVAFRSFMGDTSFHFRNQPGNERATVAGIEMPREEFNERFWNPIEQAYERVIDSIDWNRVMLEAAARHLALEGTPDHKKCEKFVERNLGIHEIGTMAFGPQCLCEALLADNTHVDWERQPNAPRYHK